MDANNTLLVCLMGAIVVAYLVCLWVGMVRMKRDAVEKRHQDNLAWIDYQDTINGVEYIESFWLWYEESKVTRIH